MLFYVHCPGFAVWCLETPSPGASFEGNRIQGQNHGLLCFQQVLFSCWGGPFFYKSSLVTGDSSCSPTQIMLGGRGHRSTNRWRYNFLLLKSRNTGDTSIYGYKGTILKPFKHKKCAPKSGFLPLCCQTVSFLSLSLFFFLT